MLVIKPRVKIQNIDIARSKIATAAAVEKFSPIKLAVKDIKPSLIPSAAGVMAKKGEIMPIDAIIIAEEKSMGMKIIWYIKNIFKLSERSDMPIKEMGIVIIFLLFLIFIHVFAID